MLEDRNIVATLFLKNKQAVRSVTDHTVIGDVFELCQTYNDSGVDKLIVFDLSEDEIERDANIHIIRNINRNIDIKVCAGGNIDSIDDVKRLLYAGCLQVILNGSKPGTMQLARTASGRFGRDRILVSVKTVDFLFKNKDYLEETFHELLVLDSSIIDSVENITDVAHVVYYENFDFETIVDVLNRDTVRGVAGPYISDPQTDIMQLKTRFSDAGIKMDNFAPELSWSDLKQNAEGLVPVIVQDYQTNEVLMLAYMDEEAFDTTIRLGKMTYHSRSRNELWTKGLTSGHYQYVKSLTADCDYDTILAKVAQVGAACHTGSRSCFFHEIVKKEYVEKNPLKVLESLYEKILEQKYHPVDGSFTNYLFDQGIDKILKHIGEESTEVILAAKDDGDSIGVRYELSDLVYAIMVLMVEKNVTWEEITAELSQR